MFALFLVSVVAEERRPVRWGILGTGSIASDFGRVLTSMRGDAEVVAVGSRSGDRAAAFAAELGLVGACAHGSYEALVADPAVDVVYVATPSTRHVSDSLLCLRAGKAVLCEKSMAPTAAEAAEVLALARERGLFFLHGVWSRFFPAMRALRELLSSGAIGDVTSAHVSFCQNDGAGSCSALAETGVYCAQFLSWVFGGEEAAVVGAVTERDRGSGHDTHVAATLRFAGGGVGSFECSLRHASPREAVICGSRGVVRVPYPFWCPTQLLVQPMGGAASQAFGPESETNFPLPDGPRGPFHFVHSEGLAYEAAAVHAALRAGRLEAAEFGSEECLRVMKLLDAVARFGAR
uniref:D-xylose 1-dehydrogenase (NADP(+), D-xylono-1,5-lactone-forming) n=1 Tax=Emiliania huxleyi TaxID=2903 RepID=A0A7S3T8Y6_EMIHU